MFRDDARSPASGCCTLVGLLTTHTRRAATIHCHNLSAGLFRLQKIETIVSYLETTTACVRCPDISRTERRATESRVLYRESDDAHTGHRKMDDSQDASNPAHPDSVIRLCSAVHRFSIVSRRCNLDSLSLSLSFSFIQYAAPHTSPRSIQTISCHTKKVLSLYRSTMPPQLRYCSKPTIEDTM